MLSFHFPHSACHGTNQSSTEATGRYHGNGQALNDHDGVIPGEWHGDKQEHEWFRKLEPVSYMPEHDLDAAELDHAEEVFSVILPTNHQPTKPVQPGKESFHAPTSAIAAERATVLGEPFAIAFVRSDQLDIVGFQQIVIQGITIVGGVANQSFGKFVEEALPEDFFDELAFVGRSALDTNGERKTVISADGEDLRALAALGGPDRKAPFFAPVKEASIKPSSSSSFPRACNSAASTRKISFSLPSRTQRWKRRWQVWYGGYFLGSSRHCAPVPKTHKIPLSTARVSCHGRPLPSERRFGRRIASIRSHWASLSSHRPRMPPSASFPTQRK